MSTFNTISAINNSVDDIFKVQVLLDTSIKQGNLYHSRMLNEQDLMVARALAAESRENSPGGSPGPLRKNPLSKVVDKLNTFR